MDYLPLSELVKHLVADGNQRQVIRDALDSRNKECGEKLEAGMVPEEAEECKSLQAATQSAKLIMDFIPRFYENRS